MRPIDKGPWPTDAQGNAKQVKAYTDWRADLRARIGDFCAYCGMPINHSLQVEHVIPKKPQPGNPQGALLDWDNMLLSCAPCNNAKDNYYLPPADFYLPEIHNVLLAFDCHIPAPGHAVVQPATGLSAMQQQKASDTIGVFKWANIERRDKAVDLRTEKRYEVMLSAQFCDQLLSELTASGVRAQGIALVAQAAQGKGFFSVWYRQFEQQPDVLAELLKVFPGTDIRCFDTTTYRAQPRNPGQADPI